MIYPPFEPTLSDAPALPADPQIVAANLESRNLTGAWGVRRAERTHQSYENEATHIHHLARDGRCPRCKER